MAAISTTVTAGVGSEKHNHDLKYREALDHTNTASTPDAIIELIPYRPYSEQINDLMRPYIDDFNAHAEQRYQDAWARYKAGERKSKPKRRDFPKMDYDYFSAHKDDEIMNPHTNKKEHVPIFRSFIVGLGDREDRRSGVISREQAEAVFREIVEIFRAQFPHLHVLGATIHLDEEGFYHMHLDYKPVMAAKFSKGLQATVSQEAVLEAMGFQPEQSIINGRDKAPIRFNALRNRIYFMAEKALNNQGLRLQYGVSRTKDPDKDSGTNQRLKDWQDQQDTAREMQNLKNDMLDVIQSDEVSPDGFKQLTGIVDQIQEWWRKITNQPFWRKRKDGVLVEFTAFDQLSSMVNQFFDVVGHAFQQITHWQQRALAAEEKLSAAEETAAKLEKEAADLRPLAALVTPENIERLEFLEYADATAGVYNSALWHDFLADKATWRSPELAQVKEVLSIAEGVSAGLEPTQPDAGRTDRSLTQ